MTNSPFVMVPRDALRLISASSRRLGNLRLKLSETDGRFVVDAVETSENTLVDVRPDRLFASLTWGDLTRWGQWARSDSPDLAATYLLLTRRPNGALPFDVLHQMVPGTDDPGDISGLLIVSHEDIPLELRAAGMPDFSGWLVDRDGVVPFPVHAEPEDFGASQLTGDWPLRQLAKESITIVGTGSIGSVAADALSRIGVGELHLVDPDRLLWHNVIRHRLGPESVGRYKVDALAASIAERDADTNTATRTKLIPHRLDVVERAELLRPIIQASTVVLCCADGIAPRRVVNHLARLARTPAIFACVLNDGSIGEIFRSRPGRGRGCLLCHRAYLEANGWLDPEADQELGYGTGSSHKPMAAIPSDLQLVGQFAAQATIATLLESRQGLPGSRLPSDHAVIGLRPVAALAGPFGVSAPGELRWSEVPPSRAACATCSLI
ncbi:HesA/MoeB/ThiF family protein [Curtobacterium flaccumfaciens]|uniref:HesA/MoeB/ThiF family protein n=1 Tax=Curtobacterium flaccumfaciens TaxID=2035 RepID=UPI0034451D3C